MKIVYLISFLFVLTMMSCRKSSPLACSLWALEIVDEATVLSEAQVRYSDDPTPANCRAYRRAYEDYINELDRYGGCTFTAEDRRDWEESIDDARQSIDDLNC